MPRKIKKPDKIKNNEIFVNQRKRTSEEMSKIKKFFGEYAAGVMRWVDDLGDVGAQVIAQDTVNATQEILSGETSIFGEPQFLHQYRFYAGKGSKPRIYDRFTIQHFQSGDLTRSIHRVKVRDGVQSVGTNLIYAGSVHKLDVDEVGIGYLPHGLTIAKQNVHHVFRNLAK